MDIFWRDGEHSWLIVILEFLSLFNVCSAWKFYDMHTTEIHNFRTPLLLRILAIDSRPFEEVLDENLRSDAAWEIRYVQTICRAHGTSISDSATQVFCSFATIPDCAWCDEAIISCRKLSMEIKRPPYFLWLLNMPMGRPSGMIKLCILSMVDWALKFRKTYVQR